MLKDNIINQLYQAVGFMKIFNAMFSKRLGGIEQAFLDYNQALSLQNNQVIPLIHTKAKIRNKLEGHYIAVHNFNKYDFFAVAKLRRLIEHEKPNCIITHGSRAAFLFKRALRNLTPKPPIIAVSHNYNCKPILGCDAVITITHDMKSFIIQQRQPEETVHQVPNMIHIPEGVKFEKPVFKNPPVIGFMARLTQKKGMDVFLKAISCLKEKGIKFKAKFAGDGEEAGKTHEMIRALKLEDDIEVLGWIDGEEKEEFYKAIDIFCMPSYHEPFGIVLLEAFIHSKPSVVTTSEGPSEIGRHEKNLLFVPIGDYKAMALEIERLIKNKDLREKIALGAFERAQDFSLLNISRMLQRIVEEVCYNNLSLIK
jgi:glycosyltransferase involved in cell wall biosynthesis